MALWFSQLFATVDCCCFDRLWSLCIRSVNEWRVSEKILQLEVKIYGRRLRSVTHNKHRCFSYTRLSDDVLVWMKVIKNIVANAIISCEWHSTLGEIHQSFPQERNKITAEAHQKSSSEMLQPTTPHQLKACPTCISSSHLWPLISRNFEFIFAKKIK